MSVVSVSKGIRISPRKTAIVAALVRGRTVEDALTILDHTPRRAAIAVSKTVKSARANAEHNHDYKPDTLFITEISVTPGARAKRFRPAARGRANPYQLKTSHIRVVVDGEKRQIKKKPAAKTETETAEKETK
jgi:large subunit ribosomal protein L22